MKPITDFELLVSGKNENVKAVVDIILNDDENANFKAINYADLLYREPEDEYGDNKSRAVISGSLAISIESALLKVDPDAYEANLKATPHFKSLEDLSKKYSVDIEAYSEFVLTGHGFEEHYIIENGVITTSDIKNIEYEEFYHPDGSLKDVSESGGFEVWDYSI